MSAAGCARWVGPRSRRGPPVVAADLQHLLWSAHDGAVSDQQQAAACAASRLAMVREAEQRVTDLVLLARLALGALIGFIVGAERERRGSRAGDRTFALVALGAAGFTAVGVENFPSTAEKVIAGVVTGVGFLGAGLIMRGNGGHVLGLTTAASIWATAAAGIYAGAGEPVLAVGMAAIVLLVLETPYLPVLRRLHTDNQHRFDHERANSETVEET